MEVGLIAQCLALLAAASLGAPSPAVTPPVVVTAPPPLKDVPSLVHAFGRHPDDVDRLVRWQVPLCPTVIGPPPGQTAYLLSRLRAAAKVVGVPVGGRYCTPDLIVVLTPDFDSVTTQIAKKGIRILGLGSDLAQYSEQRIRFVRHDTRPYHKFVMTTEVLAGHGSSEHDPLIIGELSASLEGSGLSFTGIHGPPIINHAPDSYMTPDIDYSFANVVLVVDQDRLAGLNLQQISAYVLMLGLADVSDQVDKSVSTILQVADPAVAAQDKPQDLTFWDRAYLGALYRASSQKSIGLEEGEIETEIAHAVRSAVVLPKNVGLDAPPAPAP